MSEPLATLLLVGHNQEQFIREAIAGASGFAFGVCTVGAELRPHDNIARVRKLGFGIASVPA